MPHVCGDEPFVELLALGDANVCPTYVGMNRNVTAALFAVVGMPHVCGDEPDLQGRASGLTGYAPRMWG